MSLPVASIQSKQNAITIPLPMRSAFAPQLSNVITNSVVIQEASKPSSVTVTPQQSSQQSQSSTPIVTHAPQLAIQTTISAPLIGGQSAPLSVLTSGGVAHQTTIIGGQSSSLPMQTQIVPQTTINTPLINAPLSIQTGGHQTTINTTIGSHATTPLSVLTSGAQQTITAPAISSHSTPLSLQSVQSSGGQQIAINVTTLTPSQQQQQQQQQQFQRLKVEDALSYLDQVKFKFNNQPQVYNDFLDIMKEFKSQSIDTPGVIQRVSTLFKGHPELIVGFNTFLPPGYKIEMHANDQVNVSMPNAPSTILLSGTPLGSTSTIVGPSIQHQVIGNLPKGGVVQATNYSGSQSQHQAAINVAIAAATNPSRTASHHDIPSQHPLPSQPTPINTSTVSTNNSGSSAGGGGTGTGSGGTTSLPNGATGGATTAASGAQPVEFNHAINYVNKIKNRFQGQPEIYKQFLEILHTYQKEQRSLKEGTAVHSQKMLTETEVFTQVAKLFQNQEDLLQEFSQFLPDANSSNVPPPTGGPLSISGQIPAVQFGHPLAHHVENIATHVANNDRSVIVKKPTVGRPTLNTQPFTPRIQLKRQHDQLQHHGSIKRQKMTSLRDVSLAEAGKYGSLNEFAFFDKVRKALRSQEVYENFVRCLVLYNHEILSRSELVHLVTPFLGKFPELLKWFKDFLGYKEGASAAVSNTVTTNSVNNSSHSLQLEGLSHRMAIIRERERERINSEIGMEIDYSACKRYGASYRALPKNFIKPECSGRTPLCREILNDTWVSFPSWSEDSTFVSSRKTQYEEYIYRCEDERYELDVVLETNLSTIRVLEAIQKKLSRMTPEDRNRYKLDDTLGGTSNVIHQKAIRRIYGDKAQEIIEGLKKNPAVAVPLVIRRLMMKEEEWREAQKQFNKIWREQNEKYYLKSLDHQGISFKQNDIKFLRSKSLLNEIETSYEERHEQNEMNAAATADGNNNSISQQPHMTYNYSDPTMIEEACNLIIHHVKRQTSIHKEDKQKIKLLLRQFIPDFYGTHRGELSDDEMEDVDTSDEKDKPVITNAITSSSDLISGSGYHSRSVNKSLEKDVVKKKVEKTLTEENLDSMGDNNNNNSQLSQHKRNLMLNSNPEDTYVLFFVNNNWYLFFRLHQILCERLSKMYQRARYLAAEEAKEKRDRKESTAVALRLKPNNDIEVEDYFPAFVDMIKQVLDGNLDSNQYEDMLREMFGIHAYIAFTMDKVVQNIVRQLQHIVCDDTCVQCTELFLEETRISATGGLCATSHNRIAAEALYQKRAEQLLSDENCFKIILYKSEGKLCIEMVDTETDESGDESEQIAKWSDYVERYVRDIGINISEELKQQLVNKPLFMRRNIRTFKSRTKNERENLIDKDFKKSIDKLKEESNSVNGNSSSKEEDIGDDLHIKENNECKFNMNSFKLVFVVQSESVMYRRRSIKKAKMSHKRVSQRLYEKFNKWHQNWLENSSTEEQQRKTQEWLVNNEPHDSTQNQTSNKDIKISATIATSSDSKNNLTATKSSLITATKSMPTIPSSIKLNRLVINNEDKPPYRKFCRYRTEDLSKREQSFSSISATN